MSTNCAPWKRTCFCIHMRRDLKKTSTWEEKLSCCGQQFDIKIYQQCFIYWQLSIPFICWFNIPRWIGNQIYHRLFYICFVFWYKIVKLTMCKP
jgi:hypothetical protein